MVRSTTICSIYKKHDALSRDWTLKAQRGLLTYFLSREQTEKLEIEEELEYNILVYK